jgi:type III secretion protein C
MLRKIICVLICLFYAQSVYATTSRENLLDKQVEYNVIQQDIRSALKDMSTQMGIPINVASNVKGNVTAGNYAGTARKILDEMVADLNLQWFFDGRSVYVTSISDAQMKILRLQDFTMPTLEAALDNIWLDTQNFPLRYDEYNNMVTVYGPPRYVAMIEVVAHYLTMRVNDKPKVLRGSW